MSEFKEFAALDLDTFINDDFFGEYHNINGQNKLVVLDKEQLSWRRMKDFDGNIIGNILYYIKVSDYVGRSPKSGDAQTFDGKICTIIDVREDNGLYEIILNTDAS